MLNDALYLLAKVETGKDKLRNLRQLHMLVESEIIIERIRSSK